MNKYSIRNAFRELDLITESEQKEEIKGIEAPNPKVESKTFDIADQDDLGELKKYLDEKDEVEEVIEPIIDEEAKKEEDLKDSYVGKIVIECNVCRNKFYKEEEDIVKSEEDENIVNLEDECPICNSLEGYTIVGKIAPYEEEQVEEEPEKESEEEVEEESKEETEEKSEEEKVEEPKEDEEPKDEEVTDEEDDKKSVKESKEVRTVWSNLKESLTEDADLTGKIVKYDGMMVKVLRKLTEQEKQKRAHLNNPDAGDYYEVEITSKELGPSRFIVWEARLRDSLTEDVTEDSEDDFVFVSEMRHKDYVIEFFRNKQDGKYYWQASYDGEDRRLGNFNIWITTRGISLYSEDDEGYPTKADVVAKAKEWVNKQKRRWDEGIDKNMNPEPEDNGDEEYYYNGKGNYKFTGLKEDIDRAIKRGYFKESKGLNESKPLNESFNKVIDNIKDWYIETFPEEVENWGSKMTDGYTFLDLLKDVRDGVNFYQHIANDSVIRERIFMHITENIFPDVDNNVLYYNWLGRPSEGQKIALDKIIEGNNLKESKPLNESDDKKAVKIDGNGNYCYTLDGVHWEECSYKEYKEYKAGGYKDLGEEDLIVTPKKEETLYVLQPTAKDQDIKDIYLVAEDGNAELKSNKELKDTLFFKTEDEAKQFLKRFLDDKENKEAKIIKKSGVEFKVREAKVTDEDIDKLKETYTKYGYVLVTV